jgi:hypothetical protein
VTLRHGCYRRRPRSTEKNKVMHQDLLSILFSLLSPCSILLSVPPYRPLGPQMHVCLSARIMRSFKSASCSLYARPLACYLIDVVISHGSPFCWIRRISPFVEPFVTTPSGCTSPRHSRRGEAVEHHSLNNIW